jgi:hypothetical protein
VAEILGSRVRKHPHVKAEKMLIEIVTHCYATKLPQYAEHLKFQLASVANYHRPAGFEVLVTVLWNRADKATRKVLQTFGQHPAEGVEINPIRLSLNELLKRSIGRNIAASKSAADLVWFTDVDYSFGKGCLKTLADSKLDDNRLYCPRNLWKNPTHAIGDKLLRLAKDNPAPNTEASMFEVCPQSIPIGGCQIVTGDTARLGYNDGSKWVEPLTDQEVKDDDQFRRCHDDRAYRKSDVFDKKTHYLKLPNVFRIRHTENHNSEREKRKA